MAEVIAIGASVIAIFQIADRIIDLCKFYIETTRDAPSDLRAILLEISTLRTIFENFKFLAACGGQLSTTPGSLSGEGGAVEGCLRSLTELEKLFPSNHVQSHGQRQSKKRKLKSTLGSLAWPLKESKAKKLLDEIMRYKSTITLALITESIQDIKDTKAKASEIQGMLTADQRQDICRWLQHTDPSTLHERARKNYEPGTGNWILRSPKWTAWLERKDRCLWIHGIPGAGKTVLQSCLIEVVKEYCDQSPPQRSTYVYYYCYFAHNQDEAKPFLRWLISQLCRKAEFVPAIVEKMYKHGGEPSLVDLSNMLARILEKYEVVYLVLDAIDESSPREDLLNVLQAFVADERFKSLQVVASSREYVDIEKIMLGFSVSVSMDNVFVQEDIRCHVRSILHTNPRFGRWPLELLQEVEDTVTTGAKGMFRWAVCQIDALQRLKCERNIVKKALKNLPRTLSETYDRILSTIPEEERLFVHHVFRWIAHHEELFHGEGIPCKVLIQAAEASTLEVTGKQNLRFYDDDTLREVCGCLIAISTKRDAYKVDEFLYPQVSATFAHYTVREYFDSVGLSNTAITRCAAGEVNLKDCFVKITFSKVLQLEESESRKFKYPLTNAAGVIDAFQSSFTHYCVVSALRSLYNLPGQICQHDVLKKLVIELFDPSRPHFQTMEAVATVFKNSRLLFPADIHTIPKYFWNAEWYPEVSVEARHLYLLLILVEWCREYGSLVKTFLQAEDRMDLLQSRLHYKSRAARGVFEGSVVDVCAQHSIFSANAIELLVEVAAGMFDPSVVLLLSIGSHGQHDGDHCKDFCLVERLLELGADPNIKGYKATPLQIATWHHDVRGVGALLKAGAHPNCTGSVNGVAWGKDTFMSYQNYLHGNSPLTMVREECVKGDTGMMIEASKKIEVLLLQYGAEEISSPSVVNQCLTESGSESGSGAE